LFAIGKIGALAAFDAFVETWGVKYDKAVECLIKDRDALLGFYDFPASTGGICARRTSTVGGWHPHFSRSREKARSSLHATC
jgi:hypothetical protein